MSTFCHRKRYLLQNKCNHGSILLAPNRIGDRWSTNGAMHIVHCTCRSVWHEINSNTNYVQERERKRQRKNSIQTNVMLDGATCLPMRYCTAGCCYWWVYLQHLNSLDTLKQFHRWAILVCVVFRMRCEVCCCMHAHHFHCVDAMSIVVFISCSERTN